MNCIDYRRLITSDPAHRGAEAQRHRLQCRGCAEFGDSMQAFDRRVRDALMIEPPADLESRIVLAATARAGGRRRWYAVAAGAVAGLAVSFWLLFTGGSESLHDSVVDHVYHEANLLVPSPDVVARPKLASVLERAGVQLVGDPGTVSYAGLCYFRGRLVPHMVVNGENGPVTVLVLRDERVDAPVAINEQGFSGTIVPVRGGSIAVVGGAGENMDAVEHRVVNAMDWET